MNALPTIAFNLTHQGDAALPAPNRKLRARRGHERPLLVDQARNRMSEIAPKPTLASSSEQHPGLYAQSGGQFFNIVD